MDKTNYAVLSIVAIVALTAVVAMFLAARAPAGGLATPGQMFTATANAILDTPRSGSIGITGFVVDSGAAGANAPAESTVRGDQNDLNDNGEIDTKDADILGQVIDRIQFCPRGKRCDLNGDHVIDTEDLGLLNARILQARTDSAVAYAPSSLGNGLTGNAADESASVGATGGIA